MARTPPIVMLEQPGDPLGGASGEKRWFTVQYLGKTNNADFPYTVANELVASQLGIALGLNIPTTLSHTVGDETFVLIQRFDHVRATQEGPPPTSLEMRSAVNAAPFEAHGAVVFDLFVANNDRALGPERRNLSLDERQRLVLYDHGNSCFYRNRPAAGIVAGIPRLDAIEKDIKAMFDMEHKRNFYREIVTDQAHVRAWCDRIEALPDFVIEAAVARIPAALERPTPRERARLIEFLVRRKASLRREILAVPEVFPALSGIRRR